MSNDIEIYFHFINIEKITKNFPDDNYQKGKEQYVF